MLESDAIARLADVTSHLVVMGELRDAGERSSTQRERASGVLVTLHRGIHLPRSVWSTLSRDDQHRVRCVAAAPLLAPGEVMTHQSAALLNGLPVVGRLPERVTTTVAASSGLTSTRSLQRHRLTHVPVAEILLGLPVASETRVVIDVASASPFARAVATADAALWRAHRLEGLPSVERLRDEWALQLDHRGAGPGSARARRVVEFADYRADRPGESLSRAAMAILGAPPPELQFEIVGVSGRRWVTDFGWPELGIVGEFDGRMKYTDPRYLKGRTAEQAVHDEKLREDDIRPRVRGFGRWDWTTALSLDLMARKLRAIGVPLTSQRAIVTLGGK